MNEEKDIFGKFDDIIYEPVHAIVEYIQEPVKQLQAWRNRMDATGEIRTEARIEKEKVKMKEWQKDAEAKLEHKKQKWEIQIKDLEAAHELKRQEKMIKALENYQISMAKSTRDIAASMGKMSLEMRESANRLVLEMTNSYIAMRDAAGEKSMRKLQEVQAAFGDDPETFKMFRDQIIREREVEVDLASEFIKTLAKDIKQINKNSDDILKNGLKTTDLYLAGMAGKLGIVMPQTTADAGRIEYGSVVETTLANDGAES